MHWKDSFSTRRLANSCWQYGIIISIPIKFSCSLFIKDTLRKRNSAPQPNPPQFQAMHLRSPDTSSSLWQCVIPSDVNKPDQAVELDIQSLYLPAIGLLRGEDRG